MTPFYANFGMHPRLDFQQTSEVVVPSVEDRAHQLVKLHQTLNQILEQAQQHYKELADRHRKEAPIFQPGDKVWLL